jgi:hypothetical protein
MSEWMSVERWHECVRMERPGVVFELRNAGGERLLTTCAKQLPLPSGWTSRPTEFRVVAVGPRHSSPIPGPSGKVPER